MWPFPNPLDLFGDAIGEVTGWAWDKVIQGIYTWFANGLLLLMEWVWSVLDSATTPRLTDEWFSVGLLRPLAGISVGITIAMMLASAVQAGFGGRPELIVDALKEGPKAIVATALTVVVMDVMVRGADVLADVAWQSGRGDAQQVLDGMAAVMVSSGGLATTFLGPLALLFGMIGLLVTTVVLFMRSSLLYLVAAFAPIIWASSVSPVMRGSARRLIHVTVALVLAKPAISVTLVVGVKLLTAAGAPAPVGSDGAAALGSLISGFACFAIAGFSPWVIYRLLPSVEGAAVSSGIVGGWGRSAMTALQVGMMAKSAGASIGASAATKAIPSQAAASWSGVGGAGAGGAGAATGGGQSATGATPGAASGGAGSGGGSGWSGGGQTGARSWSPSTATSSLGGRASKPDESGGSPGNTPGAERQTQPVERAAKRSTGAASASNDGNES